MSPKQPITLTRRNFLSLTALAAASAVLASCSPVQKIVGQQQASSMGQWPVRNDLIQHTLSRLTFGPQAYDRNHAAEMGLDAWIEEQMEPDHIEDIEADLRVRSLDTLTMDRSILFDVSEESVRRELQQATLLRAIYSRKQLYEVMVDFWSNHFNISTLKSATAALKTLDDREVVRPHALGNFREMLYASMHSPAMLVYLDNQENKKGYPNENYARELMELHTLGVGSGYIQQDVQEVARCLTGWTVSEGLFRDGFSFNADMHDDGQKRVLGQALPAGGGQADGERVCELILSNPATARFIGYKLVRHFVADEPPQHLVDAAAATFTSTQGDIKSVLRTILKSAEFASAPPKFKRPLHYVAGALRQLNADTDGGDAMLGALGWMGQPLFQRSTPDGYPDVEKAWSGNLMPRWQFALNLATGAIGGTSLDLEGLSRSASVTSMSDALDRFAGLLMGAPLQAAAVKALVNLFGSDANDENLQLALAVLVASPQYQWL